MSRSTAPQQEAAKYLGLARNMRRVFMAILGIFLLLGITGRLGVKTRSVSAKGSGYELTIHYSAITRPGLASKWSLEVHRDGGFNKPITVAMTQSYLDIFDENGLDPDPSAATSSGENLLWEFDPPQGETLTVSFDARIEPAVQWGKSGTTSIIENGKPIVSASYKTWVIP